MVAVAPEARISIVVEWENALLSEGERSAAMLRELRRQATEIAARPSDHFAVTLGRPLFEVLIVYDEAEFDKHALAALLARCMGEADDILRWRLLPAGDSSYYGNKNLGASAAAGDIVVFVDSDVVPEADWLAQILTALDDPAVKIVTGNTYIEPEGLVGKVFALSWFFPLRSEDGSLQRVQSFFANNLAMRRIFCEQHPFPDLRGTSRGACIVLASQLARENIPVFLNPRARVAHPAPNGFSHISKRALAQGRDRLFRERRYGSPGSASWLASTSRLAYHWSVSAWKICTGCRRVGLNPLLIPAAAAVATYYYLLYWAGEMMSHLRIPAIQRIRI